ncbi:hypothetical protein, partial [Frankia sp. ACN10a]|uniref:hypothetical protein n=1 Tax=Frankia sp. ACN10a TaxID=2926031 RepID=UPI002119B708
MIIYNQQLMHWLVMLIRTYNYKIVKIIVIARFVIGSVTTGATAVTAKEAIKRLGALALAMDRAYLSMLCAMFHLATIIIVGI